MVVENYILFVSACIMLCIVPGPDMIYLLSRSIAQGYRAGIIAALGINLGAYVHLLATLLGLSAILATSSVVFSILKLLGAAYLVYLGVRAILGNNRSLSVGHHGIDARTERSIFWQGFLSDALNPKVALFFLAFLPQFVETGSSHQLQQIVFLGITLNMLALLINIVIVVFSTRVTAFLRNNIAVSTWLQKAMGTTLIALGLTLANERP